MKRALLILATLWLASLHAFSEGIASDTISHLTSDSISLNNTPEQPTKKLSLIRRIIRGFDRLDERYIEPQHYVFTVMLQSTYTYDYFTLRSRERDEQSVSFAPDGNFKIGPYIGWKWIFGGYTFTLGSTKYSKTKTEIDLSIYSSQVGIDLFYRRTGSDYKLSDAHLGPGIDTRPLEGLPFNGIKVGVTGFNVYYIFNHGRFSYPAAFSQSTVQKVSCGSWMAGLGYTKNSLDFDYEKLQTIANTRLAPQTVAIDSSLMFKSAKYYDISASCGYAYNWVFAPRWLFCASGQLALAYKQSSGETLERNHSESFSFTKISPNFIGRFGLVYNTMRWYAGASAIVRSNYYFESRFSTNNTFGSMNVYVGYNFGLKKKYRQKK